MRRIAGLAEGGIPTARYSESLGVAVAIVGRKRAHLGHPVGRWRRGPCACSTRLEPSGLPSSQHSQRLRRSGAPLSKRLAFRGGRLETCRRSKTRAFLRSCATRLGSAGIAGRVGFASWLVAVEPNRSLRPRQSCSWAPALGGLWQSSADCFADARRGVGEADRQGERLGDDLLEVLRVVLRGCGVVPRACASSF